MLKIGSHVSMSAPEYLLGSAKEAISYDANAFMLYTGAPQNTARKDINTLKIEEMQQYCHEHNISLDNIIVHAPYIVNLANVVKTETAEFGTQFLMEEISRVEKIGASIMVLHPGSHVKAGENAGLESIVRCLNIVSNMNTTVKIALETMAGKGSELGVTFEQLEYILSHVQKPDMFGVCLDTCHIHDAGYDLSDFDQILDEFDRIIGLDKLLVMHINDSKNILGAHKDRHANIGFGEIGFEILNAVVHNPRVEHVVKILETPYVKGNAPYKEEIEMFKTQTFDQDLINKLENK